MNKITPREFDAIARDQVPLVGYLGITIEHLGDGVATGRAPYREEFLQELFALQPGEVSEPIVVRDYVLVLELDDIRELTPDRTDELVEALPGQVGRSLADELNQAIVDDDLFVDNFNQTYSRAVLGQ